MQTAKRILLVEDDKDDQQLFCEALSEIHPSIFCQVANNGLEALSFLSIHPAFEMVFLDLNMPKIDGFECLTVLKSHLSYRDIPVIVLSTSSRQEDINRCKDLGAATFFTKPTSYTLLFDKLRDILTIGVHVKDRIGGSQ